MRILVPLFSIVIAVGIFFGLTRKEMDASAPLVERRTNLNAALESARRVQVVRETLQEEYNSFSSADLARLHKLLPSHVDNVRLVIDINGMAATYGMTLRDIQIQQSPDVTKPVQSIVGDSPEHLDIKFGVSGNYESLKLFLADLGRSLRIVDITDLAFTSRDSDVYDFSIGLRTYWLQDK